MGDPSWRRALDKGLVDNLAEIFRAGGTPCAQSLSSAAQAYLAWGLLEAFPKTWVWVVDGPRTLDTLWRNLESLSFGKEDYLLAFPAWETLPAENVHLDPEILGERLGCLQQYAVSPAPGILITTIQALIQITLSPAILAENTKTLKLTQVEDPEMLATQLLQSGYRFTQEVQAKCEASLRGGLLDVWPPTEQAPVRIEFFGDVIDSIRTFDPTEQTSIAKCTSIMIPPALEWEHLKVETHRATLIDYLPTETAWVWCDHDSLRQHAEIYTSTLDETNDAELFSTYDEVIQRIHELQTAEHFHIGSGPAEGTSVSIAFHATESLPQLTGSTLRPDVMEEARHGLVNSLRSRARNGDDVHLFFDTPGTAGRFAEMYPKAPSGEHFHIHVGHLSEGFIYSKQKLVIVAESDLFGYRRGQRPRSEHKHTTRSKGAAFASYTDIQPGDFVVHADHGVGKYLGLYEIEFQGQAQEALAIEYAEAARLYVPVSHVHLLSRYVGVGRARPTLHRLGGGRWTKQKTAAEKSVEDLAAALLDTQAAREALTGYAFPHDSPWQHEFETSFPYVETDDQVRAIHDVKEDMENPRPMDRLICGDVGYGKTEVAMRAAFKTVMSGKQVAILVPTTVLAQQHYYTFSNRMAAFPVKIEMLSRFRTQAEQRRIVQAVASGEIDIIIGTHRLVQPDVAFNDLGLVIIDEEQRFGVVHKERLKQLRQLVDVITMTATPIPRTLYMSLTGAKDMSTIQTPPQERQPIETRVISYSDEAVRKAILLELSREGQVFYLHNRVKTIHLVEKKLTELVPEARIAVAHGQMGERDLADIMRAFVEGDYDVLLCTTIIESGVDIPNVNTILIDRADRFGMADLYQLRGRVGRYKNKAYAYLLLPEQGQLFSSARQRISAIQRYSSLGSGFKLALRDLEIRGAGNLLGAAQSGHIAAIGFDLYCQLLRRTVAARKGEPLPPVIDTELVLDFIELSPRQTDARTVAAVPYTYIEDENHRMGVYRNISAAVSEADIDRLHEEFRDRFGPLPDAVERLLCVARLRIVASQHQIQHVETRDDKLMLTRNGEYLMKNKRFPRLQATEATDKLREIIKIIKKWVQEVTSDR